MTMVQLANSVETLARQNCASIILARQAAQSTTLARADPVAVCGSRNHFLPTERGYKCKTCNRTFSTFQALGGHRASHKKLRLTGDSGETIGTLGHGVVAPALRSKVHECRQCLIRFTTGQALGGHMRKHVDLNAKRKRVEEEEENILESEEKQIETLPVLGKCKMSKRVVLQLDLNFPPPMEESFLQLV